MDPRRIPTTTSSFGVSRRENHDAADFYARFTSPILDDDDQVDPHKEINQVFCHHAASMPEVPDKSVALVATSPPYFAGKEYEQSIGEGDVPATYFEYLAMLEAVFAECVRTLEPGGRIAVNVANLGRKPYRSLSADVTRVLEGLGLLLRGEVIWQKARGSVGSCAWGSFQRPTNPVLRDLTERVVIASKGRFDRALAPKVRQARGLPFEASLSKDEFMDATTDVWEIPAESATRIGHPAPFPVELPARLIHLYTYAGDLVLDPFMGSGTTAVAALRTGRNFVGYDTDEAYVQRAGDRIAQERSHLEVRSSTAAAVAARPETPDAFDEAMSEGRTAKEVTAALLALCGFSAIEENIRVGKGMDVSFRACDAAGRGVLFDVVGAFTSMPVGLRRTETLWKALGKAAVLHADAAALPLVLLSTDVPTPGSPGAAALRAVCGPGKPVHAVIDLGSPDVRAQARTVAGGGS